MTLEMLDSEPVPGDTIRNRQSPSITLRVTLVGKKTGQEINACTLLDSGVTKRHMDSYYTVMTHVSK